MFTSLLPLRYLPLRSLTGRPRSCDTRHSDEAGASGLFSQPCDSRGDFPDHSQSSSSHTLDTIVSNESCSSEENSLRDASLPGLSLAHSSFSLLDSLSSSSMDTMLSNSSYVFPTLFPPDHRLNASFLQSFRLEEELGAGGYGFVLAASRYADGKEVAVKFIVKDKIPEHAWTVDSVFGRVPTEVLLLSLVDHPYIAKCLDLYEDSIYYYLVQELHGSPWIDPSQKRLPTQGNLSSPELTPSSSSDSTDDSDSDILQLTLSTSLSDSDLRGKELVCYGNSVSPVDIAILDEESFVERKPFLRQNISRRPSHDLFECIEQSPQKRLSESQAKYVFAQIVDAVSYLHSRGIAHCDIKDENILVDIDFKIKLIDFGSAVVTDPTKPAPYYNLFFGTAAYAASEVLRKKPYRAAPAEVWTLGILLSYLLTGNSPFATEEDAIVGNIMISRDLKAYLSRDALRIMKLCLNPDPEKRATIADLSKHPWISGK